MADTPASAGADRPASRNPNNDGSIDKGGSGGGAPDDDASIRKAAEFVVTPLFEFATTDANGVATFTFTAPQNLGAFALRCVPVTPSTGMSRCAGSR